jgi:hypothetical protein
MKDLLIKYHQDKLKEKAHKLLHKNRKEVDINKNGSGYTIKEGTNKGKTLSRIIISTKEI